MMWKKWVLVLGALGLLSGMATISKSRDCDPWTGFECLRAPQCDPWTGIGC